MFYFRKDTWLPSERERERENSGRGRQEQERPKTNLATFAKSAPA